MGWKKWPYWVKGGVISTAIADSIIVLIFITELLNINIGLLFLINFYLLFVPLTIMSPLINLFAKDCLSGIYTGTISTCSRTDQTLIIIIFILTIVISYFLIGAIFGLIYGLIKKKRGRK